MNVRKVPWKLRYQYGEHLATSWRKAVIRITHLHCTVEFRGPVRLGPGFRLHIPDRGTLIVGEGVDFRQGFVCEISGEGRVTIGAGSAFTSHALIQCSTTIDIGERCIFGQSVMIADGNHRFRDPNRHLLDQGYDFRPIRIGNGAVVMSKCTIVADIGERSIVAANSLVNKDVPAWTLVGGVPAKALDSLAPDEHATDG